MISPDDLKVLIELLQNIKNEMKEISLIKLKPEEAAEADILADYNRKRAYQQFNDIYNKIPKPDDIECLTYLNNALAANY